MFATDVISAIDNIPETHVLEVSCTKGRKIKISSELLKESVYVPFNEDDEEFTQKDVFDTALWYLKYKKFEIISTSSKKYIVCSTIKSLK